MAASVEVACHGGERRIAGDKVTRLRERPVAVSIQHAECVALIVDHDQVGDTVAVHVRNHGGNRFMPNGIRFGRSKRAVTLPQQDRHQLLSWLRHDQIDLAILIEISRCDRRKRAGCDAHVRKRAEQSFAFAQQDTDRSIRVCQGQVGVTVVVEVRHTERCRGLAQGARDGLLKASITVVQQNGKQVPGGSRNRHIHSPGATKVARDHEGWIEADRIGLPRFQCSVPLAEKHADGARGLVGNQNVRPSVSVDVSHQYRTRLRSGSILHSGGKLALPGSEKDRNVPGCIVRRDQVHLAAVAQISSRHARWSIAERDRWSDNEGCDCRLQSRSGDCRFG